MINELLLLSGNDVPIEEINLLLHPPTIKEIALIGEDNFYAGCEFWRFTKNRLSQEDKSRLENITNFEIIMSIMRENNPSVQRNKTCALMVLSLLFPIYQVQIEKDKILLKKDDLIFELNKNNFDSFVKVLNEILCLGGGEDEAGYNPSGSLAERIAAKLEEGRRKRAELHRNEENNQKIAILSRYVSILAVGENKDINTLLNYTIYQLFDEFQRYQLKFNWDIHLKAQMAGAKDLQEVDDWMKDIHSDIDGNNVNDNKKVEIK